MKRVLVKSLFISAIVASLVYFYLTLPNVSLLKNRNPQTSALMELRDQENREKKLRLSRQQIWVPYGRISDHLKRAVLLSEDASFFSHNGVDFAELKEAFKRDLKTLSFRRGGASKQDPVTILAVRRQFGSLEAATLVALLPSPRTTREKNILQRRNLALARLAKVGHISEEEYHRIKQIPLFHKAKKDAPQLLQD